VSDVEKFNHLTIFTQGQTGRAILPGAKVVVRLRDV